MITERHEQGIAKVSGESVRFEIYMLDARSALQQEQDSQRGKPAGNIMVLVPGHGQSVHGPKKLLTTAAQLSRSRMAWCIDPVPASGGDKVEGQAIAQVTREQISESFPAMASPVTATIIGWSHGAAEALHAAQSAPDLFPQYLGLCPTGLAERSSQELVRSFSLESARILWSSARQRDWIRLKDTLRLGADAGIGLARDLGRSRSAARLIEDIGWAGKRVTGTDCSYPGDVVLLFGEQDTAVRWQDAFPERSSLERTASSLAERGQDAFPEAGRVEVRVIQGSHVAPEADASAFLRAGLGLLDQLET